MPELRAYPYDVCDFCSAPHPVRHFAVSDFTMFDAQKPELRSVGAWCACELCARFIDERKWDALELRAVAAMVQRWGARVTRPLIQEQVRKAQRLFREHYLAKND